MVTNPYDQGPLDYDTKIKMKKFFTSDLLDRESGEFALVVDTIAEGAQGIHMDSIEADKFDILLPEDAESWEEYEFASEVIEEAEREIEDEINRRTLLPGRFGFETNEGFQDKQLVYRFKWGDHPDFEGTCASDADKEQLIATLEDLHKRYPEMQEFTDLLDKAHRVTVCPR